MIYIYILKLGKDFRATSVLNNEMIYIYIIRQCVCVRACVRVCVYIYISRQTTGLVGSNLWSTFLSDSLYSVAYRGSGLQATYVTTRERQGSSDQIAAVSGRKWQRSRDADGGGR